METLERNIRLGRVFTPAAPIDRLSLFAGRAQQRFAILDVVSQRGRHAVLYGERGVGKTSLACILQESLEEAGRSVIAPRVNCDDTDTYATIWQKVFETLTVSEERRGMGFTAAKETVVRDVGQVVGNGSITPHQVRRVLDGIGAQATLIIIVDEFDRAAAKAGAAFADTIKMFSDQLVPATVVLVGVADTVSSLIREHESIERALAQIRVPRMSVDELQEIVTRGLQEVEMHIEEPARTSIVNLSQGLPHYTHLISLYAARTANSEGRLTVMSSDVAVGIQEAVRNAQESIISTHHRAVMSARSDSLYRQVALACAVALTDERGYFTAGAVRRPMSIIMGRPYDIPAFARHINDFCGDARGPILAKTGVPRNYRFRFRNPLLQPFIIMDGMAQGLIDGEKLALVQEDR